MNRSLFTRIVRDFSANCPYFQEGCDAVGKAGISALVKCTSAIRQLAYAAVPDSLDEYLQIGEKTSRDCLMHFCNGEPYKDYAFDVHLHHMIHIEKGKAISPDFYPEEQHREDDPVQLLNLLFPLYAQSFGGSPHGVTVSSNDEDSTGGSDSFRPLEARYPALLFKQQLTAYVEKTFGLIRDNLKREISPLLGLCIQAPRIPKSSLTKGTARALANAASHEILLAQWQGIVTKLGCLLNILKANYVPPFFIRQVFIQIFAFINVQLFNSLLLRRKCCSYSNGEYVRSGLAMLERWCYKATEEMTRKSYGMVAMQGVWCWRVFMYKEVTRRHLEALELKGGDGGACKLLGRLLGDVIEVLEVLGC
ncbi:myosin-9-like protein isoform X1 [Tanacetum coccineum]